MSTILIPKHMKEVTARDFYRSPSKYQKKEVIGEGIVVTKNKKPVFYVTVPQKIQKKSFMEVFGNWGVKTGDAHLSMNIDAILYGAKKK
jgi:hypothetical protein